jgi:hypothetical protein
MASLRSLILDGERRLLLHPDNPERSREYFDFAQEALRSRDTILVNTDSVTSIVAGQLREHGWTQPFAGIPHPRPPYRSMWLEFTTEGPIMGDFRVGALVSSVDVTDDAVLRRFLEDSPVGYHQDTVDLIGQAGSRPTVVAAHYYAQVKGWAAGVGACIYWLDREGNYRNNSYGLIDRMPRGVDLEEILKPRPENERYYSGIRHVHLMTANTLHAFARMNCHNVKLVPVAAVTAKHQRQGRPPASVWHEIVVTGIDVLRTQEKNPLPDGDPRELRFHKVRGHYADYTRGKGLFGRYQVRLWVPEHTAGNPELGTVVSSYTVK